MRFKFTIGSKIGTGFGVLILLTLLVFTLTKLTLDSSREINQENIGVHSPSVDKLQELKILILTSKMLITNWVNYQSPPEHVDKTDLIRLTEKDFPELKKDINMIKSSWEKDQQDLMEETFKTIDELFEYHDQIKSTLVSFKSYEDPEIKFLANILVEDAGDIDNTTDKVIIAIDKMIEEQRNNAELGVGNMELSFNTLERFVSYFGIALVLGGILIAFFTARTIVTPVQKLKNQLLLLGKGIIPETKMKSRTVEIGDMGIALNQLVDGLNQTTEFARQVGSGNFESEYQPLSTHDTLGQALLKMRKDLHENERELERKVRERTEEVVLQKEEIEAQKKEIEVLYNHVTDSIKYAKRIQEAILPPDDQVSKLFPESFILYRPKDIVSGDFYWIREKEGKVLVAALDCTGHGVPGAFMTIVGHNQLNKALASVDQVRPSHILDEVNKGLSETLHSDDNSSDVKDGMDAALCALDFVNKEVEFAGAYNPLYLIRDGELQEIKGNKFPVGAFLGKPQTFSNHKVQLQSNDVIYIFSDGYPDQFGGPKGKKFMYRRFRELLLRIHKESMSLQRKILNQTLEDWRGDLEQVDDILVIGVRVP